MKKIKVAGGHGLDVRCMEGWIKEALRINTGCYAD